ncbi:hypothetical protein ACQPZQ_40390 [Pseudonocardia sp. CA-142604]|uniref:hypothetical protein n=1 Tax=Pseudonocardia sp. CA-142604 TaxID=3240024 RepID=UPI003D8D909C
MPPELRLQPDRLRSHAFTAAGLSEDLRGVLPPSSGDAAGGPALVAEHERLRAVLLGAVRELTELSAALAGAATASASADGAVASTMLRIQDALGAARPASSSGGEWT